MRKCRCMKFLCIISGCPAGAKKWHISNFAIFCIAIMTTGRAGGLH